MSCISTIHHLHVIIRRLAIAICVFEPVTNETKPKVGDMILAQWGKTAVKKSKKPKKLIPTFPAKILDIVSSGAHVGDFDVFWPSDGCSDAVHGCSGRVKRCDVVGIIKKD